MTDFWQRIGAPVDAVLAEKAIGLRDYVFREGSLSRKTKELIYLGMSCAMKFHDGVRIHGRFARQFGASKEEIYEAVALSIVAAGIPAYREAMKVLKETEELEFRESAKIKS